MKQKRKIKKIFIIVAAAIFCWFLAHEVYIITDGLKDSTPKSDVVIILGTKVNTDGTLSTRLKSRLDKGLEIYLSAKADKIFVTGGLGKEGFYEGDKMAEYLISKGVPEDDIIIDNKGNNTRASAENLRSMFPDSTSIIVVSQFYHISRTKLALKKQGFKETGSAHSEHFELRDIYSLLREFPAYYSYLLK